MWIYYMPFNFCLGKDELINIRKEEHSDRTLGCFSSHPWYFSFGYRLIVMEEYYTNIQKLETTKNPGCVH